LVNEILCTWWGEHSGRETTPKFEETESRKFLFALNDVDLQKIPVEFHCCAHAAAVKAGFFAVGKRLDAPNSAPSF
jgi:hypothetical protein